MSRYAGPFLDGFHLPGAAEFERWCDEQRTNFAREYADVLERLARDAAGRQDHAAAVGWWRRLAAQDPLNARVALGLMQALVATGDRNGALQHARVYEALVQQELELPPDREVVAFAERLRREPTPSLTPPPSSTPQPPVAPPAPSTAQPAPAAPVAASPDPIAVEVANPPPQPLPGSLVKAMSRFLEEEPVGEAQSTADWLEVLKGRAAQAKAKASRRLLLASAVAGVAILGIAAALIWPRPRQLAFGPTHRLAFDGALEMDPAISPDGKVVAYAADPDGRMRIFVRQVAGGRAVSVSEALPGYHRAPHWSPDGSQIAFQSGGAIYLVPALGGTPRPLIRPSVPSSWVAYPTWSPDGRELAYVEDSVVFIRPVEGGSPRRVAALNAPHTLAWSPRGDWIALVSGNAAFTFGAQPWGNPANLGNVAPSSIWLVPTREGLPVRITDDASLNTSPVWLPGGRGLLFVSSRSGSRDVFRISLDRRGTPIGEAVRLTTGLNAQAVSLSADGRRGAFSVFTYFANVWALDVPQRTPVGTEAAQPVTTGSQTIEGIALSPDGKWLAFDADRHGNQDIYRLPLTGGDPEQLTQSPDPDFLSAWSPNGREIAFYSYRRGTRRVLVMGADGGAAMEVAPTLLNQRSPDWAPDGKALVFSAYERSAPSQIYMVRRLSDSTWGAPRRITTDGGGSPRWSADGRAIAFTHAGAVWMVDATKPPVLVVAADSVGGAVPGMLQWAPDGKTLFYKVFDADGRSSIWSVAVPGGSPTVLVRFDDPARPSHRPEFATDGKRLYFTLGVRQSDIWTVDLVATR